MEKNFIPVYVHKHQTMPDLIRIDTSATSPDGYRIDTMFYALNPFSTYTKLNGTYNLYFLNNEKPPYHTVNVSYNENLFQYKKKGTGFSSLILASYAFRVDSSRVLSFENSISGRHKTITLYDTSINYDLSIEQKKYLFRLTTFAKPHLYWKCLPNCLCVPTDDKDQYDTKMGCMYNCYNCNFNQKNFVNDSSQVLDKIFKKSL